MDRERLTKRLAKQKSRKAVDVSDGLFPGDIGNPERAKNYKKIDQYHIFEPSLNHWTPDMRHEWKDNPREETGHGIPKVAKIYMAAKKATKLAMMLLGDNASEKVLERQARDFMRLGDKALTASINRWAEEQEFEDDVDKVEEIVEAKDETEETKTDETKVEIETPVEETKVDEVVEAEAETDETVEAEDTEEVDDEIEVGVDDEAILVDVDFDEPSEDEVEADEELESIFEGADEDDENDVVEEEKAPVASKKAGIKHLAGQPKLCRVAAKKDADELSGLWNKWETPNIR